MGQSTKMENQMETNKNKAAQLNQDNMSKLHDLLSEHKDDSELKETLTNLLKQAQLNQDELADAVNERETLKNKNNKIKKKLKIANKEKDTILSLYEDKEIELELIKEQTTKDLELAKSENKKLTQKSKRSVVFGANE